jgi:Fe2+ transport system protein FeoA
MLSMFGKPNKMIPINMAPLKKQLVVASSFDQNGDSISDVESRLMLLGFVEGALVQVKKKSILKDGPLLVEVRGRLVALSQDEAKMVQVREES